MGNEEGYLYEPMGLQGNEEAGRTRVHAQRLSMGLEGPVTERTQMKETEQL